MKNVWEEMLREIGYKALATAMFGLFLLIFSLVGLLYVCS
jgi:hypothetical protein